MHEFCWVRTLKNGVLPFSIHNDYILRFEIIEQRSRLRADENLGVVRDFLEQRCNYIESIGMKPKFRLVDND